MQKIDIHTHIIPQHLPRWDKQFGYSGFIHLEHHTECKARMMIGDRFFREIKNNCWDAEVRMKECDEHGVSMQVLSTIPIMFNYWAKPKDGYDTSRFLNDHIAKTVNDYPDRFTGLGTLPMQNEDLAVKELQRCVQDLKLAGVEIGSNVNQKNLSEPQFFSVFQAAEELGACIFIHPWEMMGKENMEKYWLPWLVGMPAETSRAICSLIFGGVLEKLPKLRVAFAHGGGSFPATIGRIEHGFEERPDLVAVDNNVNPRNYFKKIYFDSLTHDDRILKYLIEVAGEDFICLGSDYPFPLGENIPGSLIERMDISKEIKKKILWDNAWKWMGKVNEGE